MCHVYFFSVCRGAILLCLLLCGNLVSAQGGPCGEGDLKASVFTGGVFEGIKLLASDTLQVDPEQGYLGFQGVALSGNYSLLPYYEEESNTSYVQVRERTLEGKWLIADLLEEPEESSIFGAEIAIEGSRAFISDPQFGYNSGDEGRVYIYQRKESGKWEPEASLENSYSGGYLELRVAKFGNKIAASGDYLAVAADVRSDRFVHNSFGFVFRREGDQWVLDGELEIDRNCCDMYLDATAIAMDGDRIVVAHDGGADDPRIYVFERTEEGNWKESASLNPNVYNYDRYKNIDLSGDRLLVGTSAFRYNGTPYEAAGYIYEHQADGKWTLSATLQPEGREDSGYFGESVSLTDRYALLTDEGANNDRGLAYLYGVNDQGEWALVSQVSPVNPVTEDLYPAGYYTYGGVALSGNSFIWTSDYESKDDDNEEYHTAAFFYDLMDTYTLPAATASLCSGIPTEPELTDNCDGDLTITSDPATFSDAGQYEITWTALDAAGNRSVATQGVTVSGAAADLPLLAEFGDGFEANCWTVDPAWNIGDDAYQLVPGGNETGENALMLPSLNLKADQTYAVSFSYRSLGPEGGGRLTLGVGEDLLFNDAAARSGYQRVELLFSPEEDGAYTFRFSSPRGESGDGMMLDYVRVTEYTPPTSDGATQLAGLADGDCLSVSVPGVAGSGWSRILTEDGRLIAEINANGNALGDVAVAMTDYAGVPTAPFTNAAQLGRYFNLTPENGSGPYAENGGVRVRLYLTDEELAQLETAAGESVTLSNLVVTHYSGADDDCDLLNSNGGELAIITPDDSGDYGGSADYVEFITRSFSEFGLTYEQAVGVPAGFREEVAELTAFPVPTGDRVSVLLQHAAAGPVEVRLTDMLGRTVMTQTYGLARGEQRVELSVAALPSGSYHLFLMAGERAGTVRVVRR